MRTALIAFGILVVVWVIAGFLWGAIQMISPGARRRQRAQRQLLLAQIPKGAFGVLLSVFSAYRLQNMKQANHWAESRPAETSTLLAVLKQPRDPTTSAGNAGDRLDIGVWTTELRSQGFSQEAAMVVGEAHALLASDRPLGRSGTASRDGEEGG